MSVLVLAREADLHEPESGDAAETRIARLRRLDEELDVEAAPRLRELLVGDERERGPPVALCGHRLALDDSRSRTHEHLRAAHGPPTARGHQDTSGDRSSAARHRVRAEPNLRDDETIAGGLQARSTGSAPDEGGGCVPPPMTPVGFEIADVVPRSLRAPTRTRIVRPRSASRTSYSVSVAPWISLQLSPWALQRSQTYEYVIGWSPAHSPRLAWRTLPTAAVPEMDGSFVFVGRAEMTISGRVRGRAVLTLAVPRDDLRADPEARIALAKRVRVVGSRSRCAGSPRRPARPPPVPHRNQRNS